MGESGSKLLMFFYIIIEGVLMSLEEFYWEVEVADSIVCGIVKGEVISSFGFLGDPSDRFCDVGW